MTKQVATIKLINGLEARPVAMLVQLASQFDSTVYLSSEGKRVNAKSIMGMMGLGLDTGTDVEIEADGQDETIAVEKIVEYLSGNN